MSEIEIIWHQRGDGCGSLAKINDSTVAYVISNSEGGWRWAVCGTEFIGTTPTIEAAWHLGEAAIRMVHDQGWRTRRPRLSWKYAGTGQYVLRDGVEVASVSQISGVHVGFSWLARSGARYEGVAPDRHAAIMMAEIAIDMLDEDKQDDERSGS